MANVEALETEEEERRLQTQGAQDVMRPRGNGKSGSHLDVQLQGHGAHVRVEVEGGGGAAPQPVGHVLCVRERGAEGHNANGPLDLGGDVAHPGADHLQHGLKRGGSHCRPGAPSSALSYLHVEPNNLEMIS